ncbi:Isoleucine--tRNA ligase [Acidipropionibacterium jensenii]|uniref:Isoleucine--tRNA ligase n=6 Tax=Acidipropionibacterium jensenii TaxID=1749 RepID=A0A3S4WWG6_9ACTN|nr:isoleucine--tRNA ligase [Acidipropionibacterium jensenii]VEI02944.1 Isoleucine--tRNA ligase [Acidipropionibacterium jensenii]
MSDHTSPQQSAGSRSAGTSRPAAAGTAASEPATPHSTTYKAVPPQVDLPAMEHQIIDLWDRNHTFEKSLEHTKDGEPWNFFEGPPTANGQPGTHHIEARVFKDVFPRFKSMQGYHVDRKAGWDCHGLPVELAVERELGFSGKPDIEKYGVEPFNAKCRESVSRHVDAFTELTRRMGYWVNMDEAYWTMNPQYVESVWWGLKQIFDKGLLGEDHRVAPYCPRCGTTLSDHELAQGYQDDRDPSIYVQFPLTSGPLAGQAKLLVWTTTPWTLVSNTAVAVRPDVTYVVARRKPVDAKESGADVATDEVAADLGKVEPGTDLVIAEPLFDAVLGDEWTRTGQSFTGAQMEFWTYQRPYDWVKWPATDHRTTDGRTTPADANFVILADYVTTEDGTGLVHQAPAFGADDLVTCRAYGLPMVNPIRPDGTFEADIPMVGGMFFKTADKPLCEDLERRGILWRLEMHWHSYPHCWRCDTPLIYYAQPSWYIRTTRMKQQLIAQNEATTWYPETIKHGRYGDWLENNIDWAVSRTRYWGTPLPLWRNDDDRDDVICIGSLAELSEYAGRDLTGLDPHRPFIDEITFERNGHTYHRVSEVADAWLDSGSMPFAQWGYPHVPGSKEKFLAHFPADFICEAIDQTRGWFYTLMAVGTLVFDQSPYRNVLCLGHILAADGRKMSKHLGNILLPIPLMDKHGADGVRWFMAADGSPWSARRVGDDTIQETVRKVLLTYWNTVSFHALYARANNWSPAGAAAPAVDKRHVLDRWLVSSTNVLVRDVTEALNDFDTQRAGALLQEFIDELSNWYVRRSRRRFWDGDPSALWTLHETLNVLTRLMAPITPFITERVWQDLFVATDPDAPESVHLSSWPTVDESVIDESLDESMDLARRVVELGRGARAEAKVKLRQPLSRALISGSHLARLDESLQAEIRAELNVVRLESFGSSGDLVDHTAKGNFRSLGKRFGKVTPKVAAAIAAVDAGKLAADLAADGQVTLDVPQAEGGSAVIGPDDVIISERPREGWSVVNEQGETVALDLEITPELARAGLAREAVRFIQDTRKHVGLEVSDRISLSWHAGEKLAEAIRDHAGEIADEVLATSMEEAEAGQDWATESDLGLSIKVVKA